MTKIRKQETNFAIIEKTKRIKQIKKDGNARMVNCSASKTNKINDAERATWKSKPGIPQH